MKWKQLSSFDFVYSLLLSWMRLMSFESAAAESYLGLERGRRMKWLIHKHCQPIAVMVSGFWEAKWSEEVPTRRPINGSAISSSSTQNIWQTNCVWTDAGSRLQCDTNWRAENVKAMQQGINVSTINPNKGTTTYIQLNIYYLCIFWSKRFALYPVCKLALCIPNLVAGRMCGCGGCGPKGVERGWMEAENSSNNRCSPPIRIADGSIGLRGRKTKITATAVFVPTRICRGHRTRLYIIRVCMLGHWRLCGSLLVGFFFRLAETKKLKENER